MYGGNWDETFHPLKSGPCPDRHSGPAHNHLPTNRVDSDAEEMGMKIRKYKASVKIMNSYDYSHFETCLSSDESVTIEEVNSMRKVAQRLVDEAIRQFKVEKLKASQRANLMVEKTRLENEVERIKKQPKSEWTAEEKAKVKALADHDYWVRYDYDYDDDWGNQ